MKAECVDSKDAPEGYYAVVGNYALGCKGCEFTEGCSGVCCEQHNRVDGCDVIFKKIPTCIIVDIDGTLAHMVNRGPFEWDKVGYDEVDIAVRNLCNVYESYESYESGEQNIRVILMSGRDSVCRDDTVDWLRKNRVSYTSLFMRDSGDTRKDTIVKKEMFDAHINGKYNVEFVVDDRPSVCRQWHDIGLKVLRVGNPYIEF